MKTTILVVKCSADNDVMTVGPSRSIGTIPEIVADTSGFSEFGEPFDVSVNCNKPGVCHGTEQAARTRHCSGRSPADQASPR